MSFQSLATVFICSTDIHGAWLHSYSSITMHSAPGALHHLQKLQMHTVLMQEQGKCLSQEMLESR